GRQRNATGPNHASDRRYRVQFPSQGDDEQCKKAQSPNEINSGQDMLARHDVRKSTQNDRTENGHQPNQADTVGCGQGVEPMIDQHGYTMRAQQIHAVSTSEQAERNNPE